MTPQFEHDCDKCTFLGRYQRTDLYHCLQGEVNGSNATIVCRYDDGPQYSSLPVELCACLENPTNPLAMGLRRAMEIGLIAREE